jgi:hypothetical protein
MRTVPGAPVSDVQSFDSRAHLMHRTGSLWPPVWQPPGVRVSPRHMAAHEPKRCGPDGFRPTISSFFIRGRRFLAAPHALTSSSSSHLRTPPLELPKPPPAVARKFSSETAQDCSAERARPLSSRLSTVGLLPRARGAPPYRGPPRRSPPSTASLTNSVELWGQPILRSSAAALRLAF